MSERLRTYIKLILLLFLPCMLWGQKDAKEATTAGNPNSSSSIFYREGERPGEYRRWLKQNEALLRTSDVCALMVAWMDERTKVSTSFFNVATFLVRPEDEEVYRIIRHKDSGTDVRVGVQYLPGLKGQFAIRIALAFEGETKDVFEGVGSSAAETMRGKHWNGLRTWKWISIDGRSYRFNLGCYDSKGSIEQMMLKARKRK